MTSAAAKPTNEALALRRFLLLERAGDDDLRILHRALHREEYPDGAVVLQAGDHTGKLYLVDKGRVRVRRTTPFGEVVLAGYAAGECFGEMAFLDGRGHSADAIAEGDTAILTLARDEALRIFATRKALSVHCLSFFWHSLAEHIRNTNDQMKTFFVQESMAASRADPRTRARGESVSVDLGEKMALLEEKGLSAGELQILATLSTEERYAASDLIFAEGDHGTKLYIVLDGKVRISKLIPGVGEEALAILERGDFFGEMALVDDKPRSADARAHEAGTVVLAIDKRVLDDILAHDLKSAEQFLSIVCRILCQRLREINETIVKWRMLSGGF